MFLLTMFIKVKTLNVFVHVLFSVTESTRGMTDTMFGSGNHQWVCPNDRQLALRAK